MTDHDVIVIGSGPAGVSAAISSASEGYKTLVLDNAAQWGGQAYHSRRIENVFGYPTGIPGNALMDRSITQAMALGAEFERAKVTKLYQEGLPLVRLDDGPELRRAKVIVIATGVQYRKLDAPGCERLEGRGVHYLATGNHQYDKVVLVVGAGNSAGQAAVHLARRAPQVQLLIRSGNDINNTMSYYLVNRIHHTPNISVHYNSEVVSCIGEAKLEVVNILEGRAGEGVQRLVESNGVFVMIGAKPSCTWADLERDDEGYLVAPDNVAAPRILVVGDVRSGSVKRVASAAGEGAAIMRHINQLMRS